MIFTIPKRLDIKIDNFIHDYICNHNYYFSFGIPKINIFEPLCCWVNIFTVEIGGPSYESDRGVALTIK